MNCGDARLAIESIEDLRDPDHILPDEVKQHLDDCPSCKKYYKGSQRLEAVLFREIQHIDAPPVPSPYAVISEKKKRVNPIRFFIPAAAAILITVLFTVMPGTKNSLDISAGLLDQLLKNTALFEEVHAESVDTILNEFEKSTGIKTEIPDGVDASSIKTGKFLQMCKSCACVFLAREKDTDYILAVFPAKCADWTCCCNKRCFCLSDGETIVERWQECDLGYMRIKPKAGSQNKYIR